MKKKNKKKKNKNKKNNNKNKKKCYFNGASNQRPRLPTPATEAFSVDEECCTIALILSCFLLFLTAH